MASIEVVRPAGISGIAIGDIIGGATQGSIFFAGIGGALAQNNANIFWDNTNNRLGIGTSSPSFKLDVSGTLRATSNINTPFLYSSGELYLGYSGGSTGILIKTSGSVCIGVDASIAKLHIKGSGTTSATTSLLVQNSASTNLMTVLDDGNVGIGTTVPNTSSLLDLTSTTKGFLPPRMTTAQKNAISSPAAGLVVYDTDLNKLAVYTTAWETVTSI